MRIVRFVDPLGSTHFGKDLGDGTAQRHTGGLFDLKPTDDTLEIARRLAPLVPTNIFCIGANYAEHAKESGAETPETPLIFMKPTSALNHPGDPIRIPAVAQKQGEVDFECELAVVIGRPARNVSEADALDYVFGYTTAHDVSARWWQKHGGHGQWIRGKGFDTFCPLGPVIVTADEIPDPQTLRLSTTLNGEVMQDGTTADMVFTVRTLIAYMSQDTTLLPGSVILTGTPSGVGMARKPPVYMKAGDEVTVEVEKIGKITNPVLAG